MAKSSAAAISQKEKLLRAIARAALGRLGIKNAAAAVFLLSGAEMRRLGRQYLKKDRVEEPDVLSFAEPKAFPHPEKGPKSLGEIYIDKTIAARDPKRASFLVIHGLLHLLGYTHDKKSAILKMERMEKNLMKLLNI